MVDKQKEDGYESISVSEESYEIDLEQIEKLMPQSQMVEDKKNILDSNKVLHRKVSGDWAEFRLSDSSFVLEKSERSKNSQTNSAQVISQLEHILEGFIESQQSEKES